MSKAACMAWNSTNASSQRRARAASSWIDSTLPSNSSFRE
jgi:hypothetical protein